MTDYQDGLDTLRLERAALEPDVLAMVDATTEVWLAGWAEALGIYGPRRDFVMGLLTAFPLPHPALNPISQRLVYGLIAILDQEAL